MVRTFLTHVLKMHLEAIGILLHQVPQVDLGRFHRDSGSVYEDRGVLRFNSAELSSRNPLEGGICAWHFCLVCLRDSVQAVQASSTRFFGFLWKS